MKTPSSNHLWECPYCGRPCTIGKDDIRTFQQSGFVSEEYGHYLSETTIIVCPNPNCRKQTIYLRLSEYDPDYHQRKKKLYEWRLKPESEAKPFPDYIPEQLRKDYEEACLIKNKSPKASATLSRRCLQGIIRDFWGISEPRLKDEIDELQSKVDPDTWDAIDSVRRVGNIGAHMEKDVNLVIDVEPEEAGMLIWLIESLFEEWYIRCHERKRKMSDLKKIAREKKAAQKASPNASANTEK